MTDKYERECWSCGSQDLEPMDYGARCRSCGATWCKPLISVGSALADHDSYIRNNSGDVIRKIHRPSASATRRTATASARGRK